ncbi:transcriptional regulator, BadM/Rrf2 family [Denitrovibrio acetiphilus DSM 12809]|uniref:Transcriptional regulator, BadM/Rrf2 family n=1 Tax=Denitrovibrio acetiphilus (strain DSM 12809 / NBRC 114555 / N2460) TaxID=522772 RepID=D4H2H5_DENA2|nr:Rrf2 family transcriptional regulator [Denitrovibrio acetiphilus]ADD67036.1 transcriptional regulator, BadM/Rrf2 family [Denitrovibrio acetiphilus DSM 12809]
MFSMKTVYALKALQYLAESHNQGNVMISVIAENEGIPKKFLETILLTLKNEGFLTSRIGKGGGYKLALAPNEINLKDIISALEGNIALIPCAVHETGEKKCDQCRDYELCGTRLILTKISERLADVLSSNTLADMIGETEKARQTSSNSFDYMI